MPELPEVETVARQLAPRLVGRIVRRVSILDPLLQNGRAPAVRGRRIRDVCRVGKQVLVEMAPLPRRNSPLWLQIHLRMSGRLVWAAAAERAERPHLRARLVLDRGQLLFVDTRRFGTWNWLRSREEARPAGVDPLSSAFSRPRLAELLRDSRQALKPWLLRQDRLVGLGNIYASEILFAARLSPFREAGSLGAGEQQRLRDSTRRVLNSAFEHCGTTFSDFQDVRGIEGSFQRYLRVYDREGRPCRRCRTPIEKTVQQQRSTFHCPGCQT